MSDTSRPLVYPVATAPPPTKFDLKSPRGAHLATRVWPVKNPKALCLIVHGGGWHSGYFEGLAKTLNEADLFCGSYDQISCGYSDVEPGTPAPGVTHVNSFDCFVEDLFEAVTWIRAEARDEASSIPLFLIGESFGGLQVIDAAFQASDSNVKIDGVVTMGGLLQLGAAFLPPAPVVSVLCFVAKYYPRLVMPATDFESTYDAAFGDPEWTRTTRQDPKITMAIKPTVGAIAATLGTGNRLRPRAKEFPVPFLAVHGKRDVRTSPEVMSEFVDKMGPDKGTIELIDTDGHQLLQDRPEVSAQVAKAIRDWIVKQIASVPLSS